MATTTLEGALEEMAKHLEKDNALGPEINWFEFCGTTKEKWVKTMLERANKKWWQFWIPNLI